MTSFDPKVAHLLRRATLGPTMEEVEAAHNAGLGATLDSMLAQIDRPLSKQELAAQAIDGIFLKDGKSLRAGWMLRMLNAPNLFREKLTLFWHHHFATAISKVIDTRLMSRQIDTLRELALGNFRDLLLAMARDPAMLIWLDNALNVKGKPNENWARELMELFTLGIGHYTEQDVQEVARAFTGWGLTRNRSFQFDSDKHDDGPKTILGKAGNHDGGDVIDILVSMPRTGQFVCAKLWKFFVHTNPTDADLVPMVDAWQKSGGHLAPVLKAMFTSPGFFASPAVGTLVKNPIEFVVGVARSLNSSLDVTTYADGASEMGMDLYNPPDVSGWPGGPEWISSFTLLERIRLVRQMVAKGQGGVVGGLDTRKIIADNFISTNQELVDHFLLRFLHRIPKTKLRATLLEFMTAGARTPVIRLPATERDEKIRGLIRLILCSPEYQLC